MTEQTNSFFVHPQGLAESDRIGAGTRIWAFAHVMRGAEVGERCNVGAHAFIETGAIVGNGVTVKNGVSVWSGVVVEDDVFLGPHCIFTNDPNPRSYIKKGPEGLVGTRVRRGATIGAGAIIVCGNEIGQYAFVGAGAVVVGNVPDFALMVGNPARQIGWMCLCAHKLPLSANASGAESYLCSSCGSEFKLVQRGLTVICDRLTGEKETP